MNATATMINSDTTSVVVSGGAATLAVAFLRNALNLAFPFLILAAIVILVDLYFGIRAALKRGEEVRISRAIRRTAGKAIEYLSWVILGATLALAFEFPPLSKIVIGFAISIEVLSIVQNWLSLHGKKISGLGAFAQGVIKDKTGIDASMVTIEDDNAACDKAGARPENPQPPASGR